MLNRLLKTIPALYSCLNELISENNLDEEEQKYCIPLKRFMIILMQIDDKKYWYYSEIQKMI